MDFNLETLSQCFLHTLSPLPEPRREKEKYLAEVAERPGFALAVLRLVAEPAVSEDIRHAAAVNFKNHLRAHWSPELPLDVMECPPELPYDEKEQIKSLIVRLMLAASPRIQSQLSEALAVISKHDFPKSWPSLLPELKFRYQFDIYELHVDLKYCLDGFAAPLLNIFLKTSKLISANLHSADALRPLFESQRLCCRIFYSLNYLELPEFFVDHMREWMTEFQNYLTMPYQALENDQNGMKVVDGLRAAICDNINLYMKMNEEKFKDYISGFATAVWNLLLCISVGPARDQLVITAIKFLTTQICEKIIIPNILLSDKDEELFEFNHVECIRRDIEGNDLDTRRGIACELLKGIATNYKEQVRQIVSGQIEVLLSLHGQNQSANWKQKDCAIYLVISRATKTAGGGSVSTDLVNVESFFTSVIAPELQNPDANALPMLKADALKFFTTFRTQISKPVALALVPDVIRFLGSESNVIHSYAANCVEKLLLVKDEGKLRFNSSDIGPFLPVLMTNLFNALKFPGSQENQYVMKCIMRVLGVADIGVGVAGACIASLTAILGEICKNPKNPVFNHCLFEALAALIRRSCERDPSLVSSFETSLFPVLQDILVKDVSEFWPYTFQIFAQLVEINKSPLPVNYMQLFQVLLSPETWKRSGNVPVLVRLLLAYLQKAPLELKQQGKLKDVLEIFQSLVSKSRTYELGYSVLNTVIENMSYEVIEPYVGHIWTILCSRLETVKTPKFVKPFVIYMSLFLIQYGHVKLVESINNVFLNLFTTILDQFWIPHLKLITGFVEMKLTSVASTRLICESPVLLDDSAAVMWGRMLDSIVTLLSRPEQERVQVLPEVPDIGETVGYSATFVHLYNAGKKEEDPLKEVKDPREFFVTTLARLSALSPGKYPAIIQKTVEPANQAALLQLSTAYHCSIV
ncbi:hypothetical protein H6P81_008027 [Aristolochia fimbriata]|uniref:Importin N-terminal domain-containing protein n=1 Tax=Aristolochia fimbriata TaxID=158543 RepID=A0AAV7F242_ARIFI|nr:hypothetical protein H6P81_008027 [Aristolochia fimbriata]